MLVIPSTGAIASRRSGSISKEGNISSKDSKQTIDKKLPHFHAVLVDLSAFGVLGIASFFGVLIRLGLTYINTYDGQPVPPLIWAQVVGCAIMGSAVARRDTLENGYLFLYLGISTGLCGCITTFSSWMNLVFGGFAQVNTPVHGGFYNAMSGLSQTVITLAASVAAYRFGSHFGVVIFADRILRSGQSDPQANGNALSNHVDDAPDDYRQDEVTPNMLDGNDSDPTSVLAHPDCGETAARNQNTVSRNPIRRHVTHLHPAPHSTIAALFVLCWLVAILVCIFYEQWRGTVMFALVFAPFGVWTRFLLSELNTRPQFARFPVGTFVANMLGTAVLAACTALQLTPGRTRLQCQVLQGFNDGFAGCLSTVSTFVVEIHKLRRKECYIYVIVSWCAGQIITLAILGTVDFARGGLSNKCSL